MCHGNFDEGRDPYDTWQGSLMGLAGKDPLFYAQMATANQDVANAGYFCMRCHVPMSIVTGHALQPDGSTLDALDKEGVSCHFCHSMVDPIYQPGVSPPEDQAVLASLPGGPPQHYGNAMFVLDTQGRRRGPRADAAPPHELITSSFLRSGNFCGTCHEVGNVATTRQPDGTYRYNAIDQPCPDENPQTQFPLERTFSEWKLSAFANGGVNMGGRFGGAGMSVVSTCQDCHMPRKAGMACFFGPERPDLRGHQFAGAGAQVLDLIAAHTAGDPSVDQAAIARGRENSLAMLGKAASLELSVANSSLKVRVINESGHKLPTGHIEGRRVWVNVRLTDSWGNVVTEYGGYDDATAELDTATTTVYEMHVGLSPQASVLTGLPAGPTGHMALADTIEKDNRIPPRGFVNSTFESAGAPVVGHVYADGQYWDDTSFPIPAGTAYAEVRLFYQNTPKHYIEMLRDNNTTNHWGQTLHSLWSSTGRGAPIEMNNAFIQVGPVCASIDYNSDGLFPDTLDIADFVSVFSGGACSNDPACGGIDFNNDGIFPDTLDIQSLLSVFSGGPCL